MALLISILKSWKIFLSLLQKIHTDPYQLSCNVRNDLKNASLLISTIPCKNMNNVNSETAKST